MSVEQISLLQMSLEQIHHNYCLQTKRFIFSEQNVSGILSQLPLDLQGLSSICSQQGLAYKTFNK